jgi:hypothetical protein
MSIEAGRALRGSARIDTTPGCYCLCFVREGEPPVRVEFGPEPLQSRRDGRDCYSANLSPPVEIPRSGVVEISAGGALGRVEYLLQGDGGPGPAWAQLNPASAARVIQLRWQPGAPGRAVVGRAVLHISPCADTRPGAERARILAL